MPQITHKYTHTFYANVSHSKMLKAGGLLAAVVFLGFVVVSFLFVFESSPQSFTQILLLHALVVK